MANIVAEFNAFVDEIADAFQQAEGKWSTCDWSTSFGQSGLDLCGLSAAQASLLARTTTGTEGIDWRAAVQWLSQVEHDARTCEDLARAALRLLRENQLVGAYFHAQRACSIEKRYHLRPVWETFFGFVQSALSSARLTEPSDLSGSPQGE